MNRGSRESRSGSKYEDLYKDDLMIYWDFIWCPDNLTMTVQTSEVIYTTAALLLFEILYNTTYLPGIGYIGVRRQICKNVSVIQAEVPSFFCKESIRGSSFFFQTYGVISLQLLKEFVLNFVLIHFKNFLTILFLFKKCGGY